MAPSLSIMRWILAATVYVAGLGIAFAQDKEEDLSNYYNEMATGEVSTDTKASETEANAEIGSEKQAKDSDKAESNEKTKPWDWGGPRRYMSFSGATGLYQILEGSLADKGTFGGGFHVGFFKKSDYLIRGDTHSAMWSALNARIVPASFLEIFLGGHVFSNYNNRAISFGVPDLIMSIGNVDIGTKASFNPAKGFYIAGLFGLQFKNPIGKVKMSMKGTSVDLGMLSTLDFFEISKTVPIRAHLNMGYLFDNSAQIAQQYEHDNGGCSEDVNGDGTLDFEGCMNTIQRAGYDIDRLDQFRIGLGLETLFSYVSPLIEYWLEIPVNRQNFTCPVNLPNSPDGCMDDLGIRAVRQWMTFGVRVLPPVNALALDLGVDIGFSGWGPTVHEMAPQDPYRVLFGLSYSFNMIEKIVKPPVCPEFHKMAPEPVQKDFAFIGFVHDKDNPKKPISQAIIRYAGAGNLSPQITDSEGKFHSYRVQPGKLDLVIEAEDYKKESFTITIPEPGVTESAEQAKPMQGFELSFDFPLVKMITKSSLLVRVLNEQGQQIQGAQIAFEGPEKGQWICDSEGKTKQDLLPGSYTLIVQKDEYLSKATTLALIKDSHMDIEIKLTSKPKQSSVVLKEKRIEIKKKIHFQTGSDTILPDSFTLLDEIADVLISHLEIKRMEIQGHTDNIGKMEFNVDLSNRRAQSVLNYLVKAGISSTRLESNGYGPNKPIAPNITDGGRAKNRRVEFHILEREGE